MRHRSFSRLLTLTLAMLLCGGVLTSCDRASSSEPQDSSAAVSASEASENASSAEDSQGEQSTTSEVTDPMKDFTPVFRFAVCSDVHLKNYESAESARLRQLFTDSYAYAAGSTYKTLDALVIVGDFTDSGDADQYATYKKCLADALHPDETTVITVMGNHEFYGGGESVYQADIDEELNKHVVVKGYHFIGVSPTNGDSYDATKINWLSAQLEEAAADDPDKPIITFQHHHLQNTVYVSSEWYTGSSAALDGVYQNYSQILNFSGHSHGPINNPTSIYQKDYTALGTGTLSYFELTTGMTYGTIPPESNKAAQFYIVEVDAANRVRIMPYDLLTSDFFRTPATTDGDAQLIYSIDNLKDPTTFRYTQARADDASAPTFPDDATLEVSKIGKVNATVTFSQADDDSCLDHYEILCKNKTTGDTQVFKYFSEYYFEPMPATLSFVLSGLKAGSEYDLTLTAVNVWDKRTDGKTVSFTTEEAVEVAYQSANPVHFFGTFTDFDSLTELIRATSTFAYGGTINGDVFAGDWTSASGNSGSNVELAADKGYEGSAALGIWSTNDDNQGLYVFATEANQNTTAFPTFGYLRVWVDFSGLDFRKANFGLVAPDGSLFTTDECDGRNDLSFYYMAEGATEWKEYKHGDDGCFGAAQSSSVRDFKGWMAFPVANFTYRAGTGSGSVSAGTSYPENEVAGVYLFWDYNASSYIGNKFYLDEMALVADYTDFTAYQN